MKFLRTVLLAIMLYWSMTEASRAGVDGRILLVSGDDFVPELLERLRSYLDESFSVTVDVVSRPSEAESVSYREEAVILARLLREDDICLIALQNRRNSVEFTDYIAKHVRVGILNVDASGWGQEQDLVQKECRARLVEKHANRLVGTLLGLEACPWPQCALNNEELREGMGMSWGRNLCPPCQHKASKVLEAHGASGELRKVR